LASGHEAGDADADRLDARDSRGTVFQDSASFTPYELSAFTPEGRIRPDYRRPVAEAEAARGMPVKPTKGVYERYGCAACHGNDAAAVSKLGPNFKGLYGSERTFN
jgi:hypothetical protein